MPEISYAKVCVDADTAREIAISYGMTTKQAAEIGAKLRAAAEQYRRKLLAAETE